jgi:septal ring factor EnvC (AmiA/AmiB activator)
MYNLSKREEHSKVTHPLLSSRAAKFAVYTFLENAILLLCNEVSMSTLAEHPPEMTMAADDFQALEERVLRTVELLKGERELRFSVEQHASRLTHRIEEQAAQVAQLEEQLSGLQKERDAVRQRIERLLKQIEELGD